MKLLHASQKYCDPYILALGRHNAIHTIVVHSSLDLVTYISHIDLYRLY